MADDRPLPAWLETLSRYGYHANGMIFGLSEWIDTESWVKLADLRAAWQAQEAETCNFRKPARFKPCPDMELDESHWCGTCLRAKYFSATNAKLGKYPEAQ